MRAKLLVVAAFLVAASAASAATVTPVWLPPVELSSGPQYSVWDQDVAVDRHADLLAVWGGTSGVMSRFRSAGGAWQAPVQVAACGYAAQVAFDAAGNATVVWLGCTNGVGAQVTAAVRRVDGTWSVPAAISTPGRVAAYLQLQVAPSGAAVASWAESDGHVWVVAASTRAPVSEAWTVETQLSSVGADSYDSSAAVDDTGDAVVGWSRADPAGGIVWTSFKSSGGNWGAAVNLSQPGDSALYIKVAMRPGGNAVAVWSVNGDGRSAVRPATTGVWSAPTPFPAFVPHELVTDGFGNVLADWYDGNGIQAAELPLASDTWGPQFAVSTQASFPLSYVVRFDGAGGLVAVWATLDDNGNGTVVASRRPFGTTSWEAPVVGSIPGSYDILYGAAFAVDADGDAAAAYQTPNGAAVGVVILDSAAPRLQSLAIDRTGRVGRKVRFAAQPFDISPVRYRWSFGDGRSATGASVTHVYRKAGRYAVSLTATDAAGHSKLATKFSVRIR